MKQECYDVLRKQFSLHLGETKRQRRITQNGLARSLLMEPRSLAELTAGRRGPSGLTLALYLVYLCDDTGYFLADLKGAFDKVLPDWPRQEQSRQRRTRRGPVKDMDRGR